MKITKYSLEYEEFIICRPVCSLSPIIQTVVNFFRQIFLGLYLYQVATFVGFPQFFLTLFINNRILIIIFLILNRLPNRGGGADQTEGGGLPNRGGGRPNRGGGPTVCGDFFEKTDASEQKSRGVFQFSKNSCFSRDKMSTRC